MNYKLKRKSESWVMQALGKILGKSYLDDFWTTWVPLWGTPTIFTPTRYDTLPYWNLPNQAKLKDWFEGFHGSVARHEFTHIEQARRWTPLGLYILYVGPSPFIFGIALILTIVALVGGWGPLVPLVAWGLGIALTPLSVGLAWGRWRVEREPYLVQMREPDSWKTPENAALTLKTGYIYPWPESWMREWFRKELRK